MPEQELAHFKSGWRLGTISSLESFRSLCVYVCMCFFLSGDIVSILIRLQSLYQHLAGQGG